MLVDVNKKLRKLTLARKTEVAKLYAAFENIKMV